MPSPTYLAQSVRFRSRGVRRDQCWQGKQLTSAKESPRLWEICSPQSSSCTRCTPTSAKNVRNPCLKALSHGDKRWAHAKHPLALTAWNIPGHIVTQTPHSVLLQVIVVVVRNEHKVHMHVLLDHVLLELKSPGLRVLFRMRSFGTSGMAGSTMRLGPMKRKGEQRSSNTGSVRNVRPLCKCTKKVACPIHVTVPGVWAFLWGATE
jgi:hypothetical protein